MDYARYALLAETHKTEGRDLCGRERLEVAVVVGSYWFCTMINEDTHVLDTQLIPTATPSKPERPHVVLRVLKEQCPPRWTPSA